MLIGWDYGAHGIWWVLTKEEKEARLRLATGATPRHQAGTIAQGHGAIG